MWFVGLALGFWVGRFFWLVSFATGVFLSFFPLFLAPFVYPPCVLLGA